MLPSAAYVCMYVCMHACMYVYIHICIPGTQMIPPNWIVKPQFYGSTLKSTPSKQGSFTFQLYIIYVYYICILYMYIILYIYHFISTYRSYSWNCQCIGIWDDMDKKLLHTAVFRGNEHKFIIMYQLFGGEQEGIGVLTVTV